MTTLKYTTPILFFFFLSSRGIGQHKITIATIDAGKIPKEIKYSGNIKSGITWNDRLGENFAVTSETGEFESKAADNGGRDAALYAYHFIRSNNTIEQNWKLYDYVKDCPLDIEASFLTNTLHVTDLDNDGIGEIWVMYKLACTGDVSPSEMKIIRYEGKHKAAMRGESRVKISETEYDGGNYTFDKAFNDAPGYFREYAKKMWTKNISL
ncbi:M949_RS01915 family surface polysaccharide biosynthesis protein [Flavobacterium qiangtangense]|uniref:M949_RS01915 family surface polysaccharide biosynthesis protein n=1 Tax=Flavobacterium qiangtangense TaxID=1442595 RepID=A0ABW1PKN2_9FLAO